MEADLQSLSAALSRALMDGAFVMTFETEDPGPLPPPSIEVSAILKVGASRQRLHFSFPLDLARQITSDTLGETDPSVVSDEDVKLAMIELGNVVAGGYAQAVVPEGILCTIETPFLGECPELEKKAALMTDGGAVLRTMVGAA